MNGNVCAPPAIPDDVRVSLAATYVTASERITGVPVNLQVGDVTERLTANLKRAKLI